MYSVLNVFKVGIGPSSSHTIGPMKAAKEFVDHLIQQNLIEETTTLIADVYGSLSLTGKGHLTDVAILLGLSGYSANDVDIEAIPSIVEAVRTQEKLSIYNGEYQLDFSKAHLKFHSEFLPRHENAMTFSAYHGEKLLLKMSFYSIGGGQIISDEDDNSAEKGKAEIEAIPYPFASAKELLQHCESTSQSISDVILKNELVSHDLQYIQNYFSNIARVMNECIERGMKADGKLPGPMRVPRRAHHLYQLLTSHGQNTKDPMIIIDWVNLFALAVSEENAAGGRVVTAPTNGACGIVPAVLEYYDRFIEPLTPEKAMKFFLASGAIGTLYQRNASISGAEVGCQGEVGVACSMAAAGLAEILGATPDQVCMAAEIGMEHNLGLTCDPVDGQVQVPCIERNAIASVKAINSARMAINRQSAPLVSLDKVIETMYNTGKDMNAKYRETSQGGLAITILPPCD